MISYCRQMMISYADEVYGPTADSVSEALSNHLEGSVKPEHMNNIYQDLDLVGEAMRNGNRIGKTKFMNYLHSRISQGDMPKPEHLPILSVMGRLSHDIPVHEKHLDPNSPIQDSINNFSKYKTGKLGNYQDTDQLWMHIPIKNHKGEFQWIPHTYIHDQSSHPEVTDTPLTRQEMANAGVNLRQHDLEQHLLKNPSDVAANMALSDIHAKNGDTEEAKKYKERAFLGGKNPEDAIKQLEAPINQRKDDENFRSFLEQKVKPHIMTPEEMDEDENTLRGYVSEMSDSWYVAYHSKRI